MPTLTEISSSADEATATPTSTTTTATHPSASKACHNEEPTLGIKHGQDDETSPQLEQDDEVEPAPAVTWSRQELRETLDRATALKGKGNAEFGHGQWELALGSYREALGELPPRSDSSQDKGKGKERASLVDRAEAATDATPVAPSESQSEEGAAVTLTDEDKEISSLRAVLSANVAACLLKSNRWKDAVKACDDALLENPTYFKALHRRAMANESIGSWSSLSASLEDYNRLATLPGTTPLLSQQIKSAQARIPRSIELQQQKEKDEVLGKLKNLGNTVLGKFGFSLDNFKMEEQPGGGYSMSFQQ